MSRTTGDEAGGERDAAVRTDGRWPRSAWRLLALAATLGLRRLRRRHRRAAAATRHRQREQVKLEEQAERQPDDLQLAALHRQKDRARLRKGDRRLGQVRRRHQLERRILRQDAAAAGQGRIGRPQHLRRSPTTWSTKMHELGYLQELDKSALPERRKEPRDRPAAPALRPRTATTPCRGRAA